MKKFLTHALLALAVVAAAAPASAAPAATAASQVDVYFTRGEQLAAVHRPGGATPLDASLRALLAGPTRAELGRGVRTNIPAGTKLRGVAVKSRVAYVDVTRAFESGGGSASMTARLAQLVYTATQLPTVDAVRLKLDGKLAIAIGGEGVMVDHPLRRADFAAPRYQAPSTTGPNAKSTSTLVRGVQTRLRALGYLDGAADGIAGPQTTNAILAFQSWRGLPRTGTATTALATALAGATRPVAAPGPSRRIDVSVARQVALLVDGGRVVRAIHISTGARGTETPRGTFRVFRKELHSWSVPFAQWLPYASYFTGGIAFHEYPDVPAYAASHGCVRVPSGEAKGVYAFATLGTVVRVL